MTPTWSAGLAPALRPAGNLFLEDDWLAAYAAHQPCGQVEIQSLTMDEARLAFSLGQERVRRVPARVLRVLGDPLADQCWFGDGVAWNWPAAAGALAQGPAWDIAVLSELDAGPGDRARIDEAARAVGLRSHWRQCGRAPVVRLAAGGRTLDEAAYSTTLRRRLKRSRKKLDLAGEVTIRHHLPTPEEVDDLLAVIKVIEDGSWKGDEETGLFLDARLDFVRDLSRRLSARGQIEIYLMLLDGTPISYRFGFRYGGRFLDYNLAYLKEYHQLSPGRILLDEIVKMSQEMGLEAVDASRGSMERPHILGDWPCEVRDHYRLTLYRGSVKGRLLHAIETRVRPLVLRLRERTSRGNDDNG